MAGGYFIKLQCYSFSLVSVMTYLGKRSVKDEDHSTRNDSNFKGNLAIVKQDDILKQSIQTEGFEDTSQYFVQSETGRLDFIVGGILHVINVKSLYLTLPASRIGKLLRASSLEEVLTYCDKYQTEGEGRPHPVIMFDRSVQTAVGTDCQHRNIIFCQERLQLQHHPRHLQDWDVPSV